MRRTLQRIFFFGGLILAALGWKRMHSFDGQLDTGIARLKLQMFGHLEIPHHFQMLGIGALLLIFSLFCVERKSRRR